MVVAQITETGPRIVSDTRVTYADGVRSSYRTGTLKSVVVSRDLAISFAGDVSTGLNAIRQSAKEIAAGATQGRVVQTLQVAASDGAVEFIVAAADPNTPLVRVRNAALEDLAVAWIGDHDAFEAFQSKRELYRQGPFPAFLRSAPVPVQVMSELGDAMSNTIRDTRIDSVDDFCVRVACKDGAFNYLDESFIYVGRDFQISDGDNLVSKMAQSVAEGGYSVSVVSPAHPGVAALGLSFPRARLGLVYLPLEHDEAQVIHDVRAIDFANVVDERLGVRLCDPILRESQ